MPSEEEEEPLPSPCPNPSHFLRDISNYKTPKPSQNSNAQTTPVPIFFTASKQTPFQSSSRNPDSSAFRRRSSAIIPASRSKAARRLKAFELEQSQSSRKAQIRRERSIRSLSKSLSVWLNFLFENPKSCGCDVYAWTGESALSEPVSANGKRDSWPGGKLGIDRAWRSPKRQRECSWKVSDVELPVSASAAFSSLQISLRDVCSFEDLKERLGAYLSVKNQNEVFSVMSQVTKNIDDGRLRMKAYCPLVTDVGLKEKATRVLLYYHPTWLRIGLHIIFGGDSLLPCGDTNFDQDDLFLKMIIEKQFFSHAGLAKAYAINKLVEGLYRPGYFEALGNVILKRFLLLVLLLDKAKCQSMLPVKYGIDGIDGGSPLLFRCQSHIKSSRQLIHEFLSEMMHGEGDLLAHLVIVGYKVSYQQFPLVEYDFSVTNLFEDLQDGVRLCRALQLLQSDPSILMKLAVPSDTYKKNLLNCGIAMQYLKQAGVPLSDEDGVVILADDVANKDKELTLSLLWNMFIYLQLPLLINKALLAEEISKVTGSYTEDSKNKTLNHLHLLLEWIKAICNNYHLKVDNFASLVDGEALCCLVDYYFRNQLLGHCPLQALDTNHEGPISRSNIDNTVAAHNFILVQKVTTMLGNFPEVLQISDILEHGAACSERSVIILLAFLSSQLIGRKDMGPLNIPKLMGWNYRSPGMKPSATIPTFLCTGSNALLNVDPCPENHVKGSEEQVNQSRSLQSNIEEAAATVIQSHWKGLIERRNYLRIKAATSFLQTIIRAWLTATSKNVIHKYDLVVCSQRLYGSGKYSGTLDRYLKFMVARRIFLRKQRSVLLIQKETRAWIRRRHQKESTLPQESIVFADLVSAATIMQSSVRSWIARSRYACNKQKALQRHSEAATKIQQAWRNFIDRRQRLAATKIQMHWRALMIRRAFLRQCKAAIIIQSQFRCMKSLKTFIQCKHAAIKIQCFARGQISQNRLLGFSEYLPSRLSSDSMDHIRTKSVLILQRWWKKILLLKSRTSSAIIIQSCVRQWIARRKAYRVRHSICIIQCHWRGWLIRKDFLCQREAVIKIQSILHSMKCWKKFKQCKLASIEIQRFARGQIARNRLLGASSFRSRFHRGFLNRTRGSCFQNIEIKIFLHSVLKLQRWWRRVLILKSRAKSALIIQSHFRGWMGRKEANKERQRIVVIQSYWKGYLVRKGSRKHLQDLRWRVQKSSANVDNSKRLMSRLVAALTELLSKRSVRSILYTCATLDMATEHSQKCCETLVAAGAIDTLLKLIPSLNRNIADQEVLKHALSTLRNLVRYPHLARVLIKTNGSVEVIFRELLRNKEEGYFVAFEILEKLGASQEGIAALRKLPSHIRRLQSLAEDLERKANIEKRNARLHAARDSIERRYRAAVELLQLVTNR